MIRIFKILTASILALSAVISTAPAARATQYSLYVSQAASVNPMHAQLVSLLQKTIAIDTAHRVLNFFVAPACVAGEFCHEMLLRLDFKVSDIQNYKSEPVQLHAEGSLMIQKHEVPTMIDISVTADHATVIRFSSVVNHKKMISTFYGGAPAVNQMLF